MPESSQKDSVYFWPLSKVLFREILHDRISDTFLVERIWERLGYLPLEVDDRLWRAGPTTPLEWQRAFPYAPAVIANRQASIQLTRSIPKCYKQLLKQKLNFSGYRIGELFPRRTRRATAVNWLLAWLEWSGEELPENGPLPQFFDPPADPIDGHPGDPLVE